MKRRWTEQPERGSRLLLRLMVRLTLTLGWRAGHALLYPITAYFLVFSGRTRAASRAFLATVLGREVGWADLFRHYFTFAATILDRVFLLTGRVERYDIQVSGLEHVTRHIAAGRGCILLGSHLGSFEVLRALADQDCPVPVKALMYEENAVRATEVFNELNPGRAAGVIHIGTSEALLRVKEALAAGELVGILGDRIARGDKVVTVEFLGRPASFPAGPIMLAAVLQAPVILFFGIHRGNRRYAIEFEPLADRIVLSRARRQAELAAWVQRYARALEARCRAHPFNWFNFYDFWGEEDGEPAAGVVRAGRLPRGRAVRDRVAAWLAGRGGHRNLDGGNVAGSGEPRHLS